MSQLLSHSGFLTNEKFILSSRTPNFNILYIWISETFPRKISNSHPMTSKIQKGGRLNYSIIFLKLLFLSPYEQIPCKIHPTVRKTKKICISYTHTYTKKKTWQLADTRHNEKHNPLCTICKEWRGTKYLKCAGM